MTYKGLVTFSPSAKKSLKKLKNSSRLAKRIKAKIKLLEKDPKPSGYRDVEGTKECLRIRVGDYRVIYSFSDDKPILVETIGHRREVYKKHKRQQK